jgi:CSLREA domain-containing protein
LARQTRHDRALAFGWQRRRALAKWAATSESSPYRRRLRFEPLEDRRMLSITVNTTADVVNINDHVTSLREAIFAANTVPGADAINFAPALTAGGPAKILLTLGELKITDALTINGPGANLLTIDASGSDPTPNEQNSDGVRVFDFDDGQDNTQLADLITGLTLSGGDPGTGGGAIFNREMLTVTNCSIVGNSAPAGGGGIGNVGGTLSISDSVISGNKSIFGGGGITNYGGNVTVTSCQVIGNTGYIGGGIWSSKSGNDATSLTVNGSLIALNATGTSVGGGGGIATDGALSVANCTIEKNTGPGLGGGILLLGNADVTISETAILNNKAPSGGFFEQGRGGGVCNLIGQLRLNDCTVSGNSTDGFGGGVYGRVSMYGCTINDNSAGPQGGGVFLSAPGSLENCTITGNKANDGGGVFGGFGSGANMASIRRCTIVANQANLGGGIFMIGAARISGTIVAGNTGLSTSYIPSDVVATLGSNLEINDCLIGYDGLGIIGEAPLNNPSAAGNLVGGPIYGFIDPKLGPLTNNGGSTLTFAPRPGSPVINWISALSLDEPEFDQRGAPFARRVGGATDIGAVEHQPNPLPGDYNFNGIVDAADYTAWRDTLGSTNDLRADGGGTTAGVPDGVVDSLDYDFWKSQFGNVLMAGSGAAGATAEPTSLTDATDGVAPSLAETALLGGAASAGPIVVDTTADVVDFNDGVTSLREAIFAANLVSGADTIDFAPALTAGGPATILLTQGVLAIAEALTISGPGAYLLTIDAQHHSGIFTVGGPFVLSGLTLTNGNSAGEGGALNYQGGGSASIIDMNITGNSGRSGGGISARGDLTIINSTINGNTSDISSLGGGIYFKGFTLTISNSTINGNTAGASGGGIYAECRQMTITDSKISGNQSNGVSARGGGIYISITGGLAPSATISDTIVSGNSATSSGGGIFLPDIYDQLNLSNTIISGNTSGYEGGGVYGGIVTVSQSQVSGNQAAKGAGGISGNIVSISASTIAGNAAGGEWGGGIRAATVTINDSTISGNHTGTGPGPNTGGGVFAHKITIANSTITNNYTKLNGAKGGALFGGLITISDSTISGNYTLGDGAQGGAVYSYHSIQYSSQYSSITNTVLTGNHTAGRFSYGGALALGQSHYHLKNLVVTGNYTLGDSAGGGGIGGNFSDSGTSFDHLWIANNYTMGNGSNGGGMSFAGYGYFLIANSEISGNATRGSASGGGISSSAFSVSSAIGLDIVTSTISGNQALGGGGIEFVAFGPNQLRVIDSTISGNQALGTSTGGGIDVHNGGTVTLDDSTITGNHASNGGGVYSPHGSVRSHGAIIARNTDSSGHPDMNLSTSTFASDTLSFSLLGDRRGTSFTEAPVGSPDAKGNLIGGPVYGVIDAMLAPLTYNGGPVYLDGSKMLTQAPLAGSPVINIGDPTGAAVYILQNGSDAIYPSLDDQRGAPFTRTFGGRIDMGAIEIEPVGFLAGDYNGNGIVDAADYTLWRDSSGASVAAATGADGNGDGKVNTIDYLVWRTNFGKTLPVIGPGGGATAPALAEPVAPDVIATPAAPVVSAVAIEPLSSVLPNRSGFAVRPQFLATGSSRDDALLLWVGARADGGSRIGNPTPHGAASSSMPDETGNTSTDAIDDVFAALAVGA